MPKHRKRRIMLSIVSIVLFVVLSAQLSTVSFSVTAAGEHGELVAEEYERYRERFDRIEKIGDLENQGFRLLEDQIFAMPLQKLPEEAVDTTEEPGNEVWFYAALDTRYHRLAVFIADASGQILYKTDQLEANYCYPGEMRQGCELEVTTDYNDVGKLQYYFGQQGIVPAESIYAENVKFILLVPVENEDSLRKNLTETTCGKVKIEKLKETYFIDKE